MKGLGKGQQAILTNTEGGGENSDISKETTSKAN